MSSVSEAIERPPSAPRAYPLVGHTPQFRADRIGFLMRCARRGDVVELRLGRGRAHLLNDPDDVHHVLVSEHEKFEKTARLTRAAEPGLFGEALVASAQDGQRAERRAVQPVYNHNLLSVFAGAVVDCTDELLDSRWAGRGDVDLVEETVALAHRVRQRVLVGAIAPETADELRRAIVARQRYIRHAFLSALPHADRLPTRARRGYRRAEQRLERHLLDAIRVHRAAGSSGPSLLSQLLEARSENGTPIGDRRVLDEARTVLASYEVSSRGLAWTLYLLADHPETQTQLASELEEGPAGGDRAPSPGDISRLAYAQMVFSEALRLYPPTWLFTRTASEDVRLPSGAAIHAGSTLYLCPYTTHRDPRYFPDPERFDPERFRPAPGPRTRPRYAYFPFGGGPRVCIGEGFARMEAALVLSRILRRFELSLAPGRRAVPVPRVTLEPRGGVRLQLRAR